jgi:uncharacterized membrane protein YqjE
VFDGLRRVGEDIASLAALRVELFGVELREQFDRWLRVLVLALATVVLGCIGLGFVAVFVTVAFWDSQPLLALGLFALLFVGAAAWCAGRLGRAVAAGPAAFETTIAEFRRDAQSLGRREGLVSAHGAAAGASAPGGPEAGDRGAGR